jgi:hypothetical protein
MRVEESLSSSLVGASAIPKPTPKFPPKSIPTPRLQLKVEDNFLTFDSSTKISFQRTLRIPDDGKVYPVITQLPSI